MPEPSLPLPDFDGALLVRTDYADERAWQRMIDALQTPSEEGWVAHLSLVDDPVWDGASPARLAAAVPGKYEHPLLIVSDGRAQAEPGFPVLVLDVRTRPPRCMRVAAASLWAVENNLSIANLDWEDYANNADPDGVYRKSN